MLRTILVDNEKSALKVLEHLLQQYPGIEIVEIFTDASQALELIKKGNIHLVFMDIDMPNLNGIAVAKKIFMISPSIDIVFVTAYSHFAVEAFELNVSDYIMKPVSYKRLNKTIERILQIRLQTNDFSEQKNKNQFFYDLITKKITNPDDILSKARLMHIDFTQSFSYFFLLISDSDKKMIKEMQAGENTAVNALIEELKRKMGLVVWQTEQGIGILDYTIAASADCKNEEMIAAADLKDIAARYFPDKVVAVGIANRYSKLENFADRYIEARNAALIGIRVSPSLGIYHIVDSGFLPVLHQYVDKDRADNLIDSTIGKLIEHDRVTGADLFHTMETIILKHSFQEVANILFIHYKTVLFRKQAIEKILGISMNSFAGRTILGMALTLFYLRDIPDIHNE